MKSRWSALFVSTLLLACANASADDGEKTLKRMTGGNTDNQLTVLPEEIGHQVSDAEHAFIDMMKFYVPAQKADGTLLPVTYNDIDGNLVEELTTAKPLVSVFIYGPAEGVEHTAFAHSFMDTFAGFSRDDGLTWKTTNLSQSADRSSFTLGVDSGHGGGHDVPTSHTKIEKDDGLIAFHAPGMDYPYTNQCTDCHGKTLEGHEGPSCYACHGPEWKEEAPSGITVLYIDEAEWKPKNPYEGKLDVEGEVEGLDYKTEVTLVNGVTDVVLATEKIDKDGEFEFLLKLEETPPCTVAVMANGEKSLRIPVIDYKTDEPLEVCEGEPLDLTIYPGGAYNVFQATAGNKVLVAWPSRFCKQGQPAYSFAYRGPEREAEDPLLADLQAKRDAVVSHLGINVESDLYLTDLFGVGGKQRSIDFADENYPQAGEVPFGCVWTARGVLLSDIDTGGTKMVWTKPERLTSGRRDPNRIEVKGVEGAGFVITWQEDPDGLRPGQGLGPGEGWSGAVAHDKTDIWYSFIPWEEFDWVENPLDPTGAPVNMASHDFDQTNRPQVYVPMAVPMRLTNNDKCNPVRIDNVEDEYFSYCNVEFAADYGLQNFCADRAEIPQGQSGTPGEICINEDGLPNFANTASTRPRTSLQGYDSDSDARIDSAWVIVAAEESKGLGRAQFLPDGTPCDEDAADASPDCGADIGKNQWYFSFDMGRPDTSAEGYVDHENGLVQNLVNQGNMLNQPEVDWRTGNFYPALTTSQIWIDSVNLPEFEIWNTEIARRSSLLVQPIAKAQASLTGILATPSWKQGAMRQGGPADTMLRRIVLPSGYYDSLDNNPYAFANMVCDPIGGLFDPWLVDPGTNPYYPGGICGAPATNLSSVVPDVCKDDDTGAVSETLCPTMTFNGSVFGTGSMNPILQGYIQGDGNKTRVLTWHQCPGAAGSDGTALDTSEIGNEGYTPYDCDTDGRSDPFVNLRDQSWYNPLDISKGHRGFIDGDFVMFLYAWSPNWRLNAKGNDRYDLYVRRSFDGGASWTTTPTSFTASDGVAYAGDGTVTCETYRSSVTGTSGTPEPHVCYAYDAGDNEQARNVTQHRRMRVTTLDPRYAPTAKTIEAGCVDLDDPTIDPAFMLCGDTLTFEADQRDPSRYFMVFETGDNSTVQVGEADPMDLYYSQALEFGDNYVVWADPLVTADFNATTTDDPDGCYPSNTHEDDNIIGTVVEGSGFCNEFDRMNAGGDTQSSEANLEANPDGSKLYSVWGQWVVDEATGDTVESEAMARRIWWIDGYISLDNSWTLPGTNQPE